MSTIEPLPKKEGASMDSSKTTFVQLGKGVAASRLTLNHYVDPARCSGNLKVTSRFLEREKILPRNNCPQRS